MFQHVYNESWQLLKNKIRICNDKIIAAQLKSEPEEYNDVELSTLYEKKIAVKNELINIINLMQNHEAFSPAILKEIQKLKSLVEPKVGILEKQINQIEKVLLDRLNAATEVTKTGDSFFKLFNPVTTETKKSSTDELEDEAQQLNLQEEQTRKSSGFFQKLVELAEGRHKLAKKYIERALSKKATEQWQQAVSLLNELWLSAEGKNQIEKIIQLALHVKIEYQRYMTVSMPELETLLAGIAQNHPKKIHDLIISYTSKGVDSLDTDPVKGSEYWDRMQLLLNVLDAIQWDEDGKVWLDSIKNEVATHLEIKIHALIDSGLENKLTKKTVISSIRLINHFFISLAEQEKIMSILKTLIDSGMRSLLLNPQATTFYWSTANILLKEWKKIPKNEGEYQAMTKLLVDLEEKLTEKSGSKKKKNTNQRALLFKEKNHLRDSMTLLVTKKEEIQKSRLQQKIQARLKQIELAIKIIEKSLPFIRETRLDDVNAGHQLGKETLPVLKKAIKLIPQLGKFSEQEMGSTWKEKSNFLIKKCDELQLEKAALDKLQMSLQKTSVSNLLLVIKEDYPNEASNLFKILNMLLLDEKNRVVNNQDATSYRVSLSS